MQGMHTDNRLPCESIPGLGYLSDSILNILIGKFKLKVLEKSNNRGFKNPPFVGNSKSIVLN